MRLCTSASTVPLRRVIATVRAAAYAAGTRQLERASFCRNEEPLRFKDKDMKHATPILAFFALIIAALTLRYYGSAQAPQRPQRSTAAGEFQTGVRGTVLLSGTCPFPAGSIAGTPLRAAVSAAPPNRALPSVTVRSAPDGSFALSLPTGPYLLSAQTGRMSPACPSLDVIVPADGYATAVICCAAAP